MMIRTPIKTISQMSRATQGVLVMNLKRDDVVASVAVLAPKGKGDLDLDDELQSDSDNTQPLSSLTVDETITNIPTNGQG
jgi:DNA gyrase/topoisomerase IV subunit A